MASLEYDRLPLSDEAGFEKHFSTLTQSQKGFVSLLNDWYGRGEFLFVLVTGGPGCGKTHAVVETLRYLDLRVVKMSFTARLALKIGGKTVHKTMFSGKGSHAALTEVWNALEYTTDINECLQVSERLSKFIACDQPVDIVVIDEIGMLPFWLIYQICDYFRQQRNGIAIVCMGDKRQLKPVKSEVSLFYVDFNRFFPDAQQIEMNESKRFTPEYEMIINQLRQLMTIKPNEETTHPLFVYISKTLPVVDCITQEMLQRARFVLAFKNDTVNDCNDFYLDKIVGNEKEYVFPILGKKRFLKDNEPPMRLRKNCRAMVTQNNCGEGVCNGTSVQFLEYDRLKDVAVCRKLDSGQIVRLRRSVYNGKIPLVPGFAITIHKFQGETIDDDNIVMCFDKSTDLNLIYTALSRVRDANQILAVVL